MSITLELTPQEEELVRNAAQEKGQTVTLFLKERVFRDLIPSERWEAHSDALWQQLSSAGEEAGRYARDRARATGSSVVYAKGNEIVEEMPDGARHTIYPASVATP